MNSSGRAAPIAWPGFGASGGGEHVTDTNAH
jgi:hypothetical protein